jgi:uncharacterized membrane protein
VIPTLTLIAAVGAGLVAGIFFAFSNFVMAALGRLPPAQGVAAMQAINVTVLNPLFFAVFFGTAALALLLAALALLGGVPGTVWTVGGTLLYVGGCIAVTMLGNVPLNNALKALAPDSAEAAALWTRYLDRWTRLNTVRTVASLAAAVAFTLAWRT